MAGFDKSFPLSGVLILSPWWDAMSHVAELMFNSSYSGAKLGEAVLYCTIHCVGGGRVSVSGV